MLRTMIVALTVALIAALSLPGAADAQAQGQGQKAPAATASTPKNAAAKKSSAARTRPAPARPSVTNQAEQNAFDRAAQSNH